MHKNTLKKPKSQLHPRTLRETIRIEANCLSFSRFSYVAGLTRLLGIFFSIAVTNNIYIEIYVKSATLVS